MKMFGTGSKKMLIVMILKILEKYSDERRPLTQKKILELLQLEYGMKCDRRSVKSNLMSLKEFGLRHKFKAWNFYSPRL